MLTPTATQRFAELPEKLAVHDYNFEHFRTKHLVMDMKGTLHDRGVRPGELAPDFELPRANGGIVRLSELRGKPVLLHFGSLT